MELYFMRHGETAWSLTGQHTGRTDLPLTPHGEAEAQALGTLLRGVSFAHVFTSPRQRAQRTAALVGLDHPIVEPDLAEWDYGDYEGQRSTEIHARRPNWDIYVDGCPGGESPEQITTRADRFITRVRAFSGRVAVFSHGHFGRVLAVRWLGLPLTAGKHFGLSTASCAVLDYDPGHGLARIVQWNRTAAALGS